MGKAGVEPATHGFSVREIETLNTPKQNTYDFCHTAAAINDAKIAHENQELQAVIDRWPTLPEHTRKAIIELVGASGQKP